MEHQRGAGDLDVATGLQRRQHAGRDAVRQAVLVHLLLEALDLVLASVIAGDGRGRRVLALVLGAGGGGLLGLLALRGPLGLARGFRCGNHGASW